MKKQVMEDNINGFPGYHITREGLLYSRYNKVGKLTKVYHKNKPYTRSNGYQQIVLKIRKLGLVRRAYIHRLVAEAYIPNPLNKPCVCHRDNNPLNNHYKNLYWGTYSENMQQCIRDGRFSHNSTPGKIGQDSPTSKYSNRLKLRVFRYKHRHPEILLRELSTKFKMPLSVISKIIKGIDPITKPYL